MSDLEKLTDRVATLNEEALALRTELARTDERVRVATIRFYVTMVALILVLGGLVALSISNRALGNHNRDTFLRIQSCTTEGGECYKRNQAATQKAVDQLEKDNNATNLKLAKCALVSKTPAELDICMAAR